MSALDVRAERGLVGGGAVYWALTPAGNAAHYNLHKD